MLQPDNAQPRAARTQTRFLEASQFLPGLPKPSPAERIRDDLDQREQRRVLAHANARAAGLAQQRAEIKTQSLAHEAKVASEELLGVGFLRWGIRWRAELCEW